MGRSKAFICFQVLPFSSLRLSGDEEEVQSTTSPPRLDVRLLYLESRMRKENLEYNKTRQNQCVFPKKKHRRTELIMVLEDALKSKQLLSDFKDKIELGNFS